MPMLNATNVRRCLDLLDEPAVRISPSKQRLVQRAVAKARARTLQPYTQGEKLDGEEGSLNRLCEKIYLESLVEEHNSAGKHLELNQAVCVGYQFSEGVIYGNFTSVNLLLHAMRSVNTRWPMGMGFDATFGLSNKQFELMGITTNSIKRRANPICLAIVNKESAIGYEKMFDGMEGGVFQLAHKLRLCRPNKKCEVCDAVREQIEQEPMQDILTPPKPKKKGGKIIEEPFVFQLPLEKPMCDNTTKFSKWIAKKKPHLLYKILQCAAHLTGIAWQKKSHTKYFDNQKTYTTFYKLLVRSLRCSSTALAYVIQRAIVVWLADNKEPRAAEWFEKYWTGLRGHYMLAHAEIAGTNNNNGTEGNWGGVKKAVCGSTVEPQDPPRACMCGRLFRLCFAFCPIKARRKPPSGGSRSRPTTSKCKV